MTLRYERGFTRSKEFLERCRKYHDVTPNGVVFMWELAGPSGATFWLFEEDHNGDALSKAADYLRGARDVVGEIKVVRVREDEF